MRLVMVIFMVLAVAATTRASDLGNRQDQTAKPQQRQAYENPETPKQGGDTVEDALPIDALPFSATGTTEGYANDYDAVCPYLGSTAPEVVYSFSPAADVLLTIDLCGSSYDTKTYVMDTSFTVLACNDDFYGQGDPCGDFVSRLDGVFLAGGGTYYIFVDGYDAYYGEYALSVTEYEECFVACPANAVDEGEPPLQDGYDDQYNSGCGGHPSVFQGIDWINVEPGHPDDGFAWLCGQSGWFQSSDGLDLRDTDWFRVFARETGEMEATLVPEHPCLLIKVGPPDCATAEPEITVPANCQEPGTLSFPVTAQEEIWLWVGPIDFTGPVTEFTYFLAVSNNTYDVIPVDRRSWGQVKALFR